jgi:hypothetical protein
VPYGDGAGMNDGHCSLHRSRPGWRDNARCVSFRRHRTARPGEPGRGAGVTPPPRLG